MIAQTRKKLNPFAPEYNPIAAGVSPSTHAPAPLFLSPFLLPHQFLTYLPSSSHKTQQQFHSTPQNQISTNPPQQFHSTPQNHISTNPPPAVAARNGQLGRGYTRRGRGRGRGRERGEAESVGLSRHERFSKRGMHTLENRHKIMPLKRHEQPTTVMIKNVPYDCGRKELMTMLDGFCLLENHKAGNEPTSGGEALIAYAYDFLYLPIDFRTKKSRGFAFVNFTSSRAVWSFYDSIHLTNWGFLNQLKWQKRIEIVCAKIQGKEELLRHFSESVFECGSDEYLPVCFSPARDGSGQPVELTVVGKRRLTTRRESSYNH